MSRRRGDCLTISTETGQVVQRHVWKEKHLTRPAHISLDLDGQTHIAMYDLLRAMVTGHLEAVFSMCSCHFDISTRWIN